MGVKEIESLKDFNAIINSGKPVVVDFWAPWCGPCKQMSPVFEKLSGDPENGQVEFYKVDIDKVPDVAQEVGIRSIPAFMSFNDGNKRSEVVGANLSAVQALLQDTAKLV